MSRRWGSFVPNCGTDFHVSNISIDAAPPSRRQSIYPSWKSRGGWQLAGFCICATDTAVCTAMIIGMVQRLGLHSKDCHGNPTACMPTRHKRPCTGVHLRGAEAAAQADAYVIAACKEPSCPRGGVDGHQHLRLNNHSFDVHDE